METNEINDTGINKYMDHSQPTGKKSGNGGAYFVMSLILFLLSATALAVVILFIRTQTKKPEPEIVETQEEVTYNKAQVDLLMYDAIENAKAEAEDRVRNEMNSMLTDLSKESSGILKYLRQTNPDQVIFIDSNKYQYYPVDTSLRKNVINNDFIRTGDSSGFFSYANDGNTVTSHAGIDVSTYQKDIDWNKVKAAGVEFAIIRTGFRGYGSGAIVEDSCFLQHMQGAQEAGIKVGVYFFSQAVNVDEAIEEADYVLSMIAPYKIDYPVIIDVEEIQDSARTDGLSGDEITDCVCAFCDRIAAAGYKPMVYANLTYYIKKLNISRLDAYDKWFAYYNDSIYFPYEIGIWQYTADGTVDGISGKVDLNISFYDYGEVQTNE